MDTRFGARDSQNWTRSASSGLRSRGGAGAAPASARDHSRVSRLDFRRQEDFGPPEPPTAGGRAGVEALQGNPLHLSPATDAQKWLQSQSLQLLDGLAQERLLLNDQEIGLALPTPLLVVLITWATAIFISFGLLARPNATIIASLLIAALAVAGAIFMINELGSPFGGLIQISSAPAHAGVALLGQ